ncbi:MAG: hypothetical protein IPK57_10920 [Chitinophagaceae bacterium]|nr:hypothetical protein [Chitinophagaceae bacterium]
MITTVGVSTKALYRLISLERTESNCDASICLAPRKKCWFLSIEEHQQDEQNIIQRIGENF